MDLFVIAILAIIGWPIITYFSAKTLYNRDLLSKRLYAYLALFLIISILLIESHISTVSENLDAIILFFNYGIVLFFLWVIVFNRLKFLRWLALISLVIIFLITGISCTIGWLGLAWAVGDYEVSRQEVIEKKYVYREYFKGNATSDYRVRRVEVHKRITWVPFLEIRVFNKDYSAMELSYDPFSMSYDSNSGVLELRLQDKEGWRDVIELN